MAKKRMLQTKTKKLPAVIKYDEPRDELLEIDSRQGFYPVKGIYQNDDISFGQRILTVKVGEDIQRVIDSVKDSGGIIKLVNGTHKPPADLTLYSNIYLQGENAGATVIDFVNNGKGILIVGTNSYTTGTVAVTNNSQTVTGTGTTWTSAMVGRSILLSGLWYTITARASNTSITISAPFAGVTLSGASYTIATIKTDVKITNLTIKNASSGIKEQYTHEVFFSDVDIQTSVIGIEAVDSSQTSISEVDLQVNNTNFKATNCHFFGVTQTGAVDAQAGHGFQLDTVTNSMFSPLFALNSSSDGINITDCSNLQIDGTFVENAGNGAEFVSGNSDISMSRSAFEDNGSDGIKLTATSDNIHIFSGSIQDNGGYGLNIAASTCDNATIIGNNFAGNSTAAHTDSGTGTVIVGNTGVSDNTTLTKSSGSDSAASGTGNLTNTVTTGFKPTVIHYVIEASDTNETSASWGTWTDAPSYMTAQTEGGTVPTVQSTNAHTDTFTDGAMAITFGNTTSTGFDITYSRNGTFVSAATVNYVALK